MWKAKEWWPSLNSSRRKVYLRTHIPVSPWLLWRLVPHQFIARSIHSTYHKEAFIYFLQLVLNKSSIFISFLKGLSSPKPATALPVPDTDGMLNGFPCVFCWFFPPGSARFAYETEHLPALLPHPLLIQKGPHFLPLEQAAHSAKGKSQDALGQKAYRRSLEGEKKPKTNKIPNPFTPPKVTHMSRTARRATELLTMRSVLQSTALGHSSATPVI